MRPISGEDLMKPIERTPRGLQRYQKRVATLKNLKYKTYLRVISQFFVKYIIPQMFIRSVLMPSVRIQNVSSHENK